MKTFDSTFDSSLGMSASTFYADAATRKLNDADETARFLNEEFPIRTVKEELEKAIDAYAEKKNLKHDEVIKHLRKKCGGVNVSNWLSGKNPLKKESALKIAFALEMGYKETSWFLMQGCWLDGFYMRDYKDIIYRFCLENKMDFEQAKAIIKKHSYLEGINNPGIIDYKNRPIGRAMVSTAAIDKESTKLKDEEQLDAFIEQNREYFGTFRREAYIKFMDLYNSAKKSVKDGSVDVPTDEDISKLVAMGIPSLKGKRAIINDILKKIADDALSRTTLSEITGRQEIKRSHDCTGKITEVKRKHLILFWLYINAGTPDFGDIGSTDKESAFDECQMDINDSLLEPCGMPLLDPRNPFDWIVMNAIHYAYFSNENDDENNSTVDRINTIMELLFERSGDNENAPACES